jgi:hypothetical protein
MIGALGAVIALDDSQTPNGHVRPALTGGVRYMGA